MQHEIEVKFGIHKIQKFSKIKEFYEKKNFVHIDEKIRCSILKLCFTKFCGVLLLSNGRVMTKGNYLLGRTVKTRDEIDVFDFVDFVDKENLKKNNDIKIFEISAAKDYILTLDNYYRVWGWGSNFNKQLDHTSEEKEFLLPKLLYSLMKKKEFIPISQIYAFDHLAIAITQDNHFLVWGENRNIDFEEEDVTKKNKHVLDKLDLSRYIEKEILKNDTNITEEFKKSRKILNNFREKPTSQPVKNDSDVEEDDDTKKEKNKNMNLMQNIMKQTSLSLFERIEEYEKDLENLNNRKTFYRNKTKIVQDELNQLEIDREKIYKKINDLDSHKVELKFHAKKDVAKFIKKKGEESESSNTSENTFTKGENFYEFYDIHRSTLNRTLEKLMDKIDIQKQEESDLMKEIENIVENEKNSFFNKKTMQEVSDSIKEYVSSAKTLDNFGNSQSEEEGKNIIEEIVEGLNALKTCTFNSIYEDDIKRGGHKSAENLLKESTEKLELFINSHNQIPKSKKLWCQVCYKLIGLKVKVIEEQNVLINFLINLFYNMEEEIFYIYENYFFSNVKNNNVKFNPRKIKEYTKRLIVFFLKESSSNDSNDNSEQSKFNIIKEGEISGTRNPYSKNKELFKPFVENLDMDELIVISKIPENDLENYI